MGRGDAHAALHATWHSVPPQRDMQSGALAASSTACIGQGGDRLPKLGCTTVRKHGAHCIAPLPCRMRCRVVTGYQNIARKFFAEKGFEHVVLLSADGELRSCLLAGLLP